MFTKGLVFGKFYPFHKGHEAMIRFASGQCQKLWVVICCSNSECDDGSLRLQWISETFSDRSRIEPIVFPYDESILPNTSIPNRDTSLIWARAFSKLLPDLDLLVTSEKYGDYVAHFMGIEHLPFDPDRRQTPISATDIRGDVIGNWSTLPDVVKRSFQKVICINGTESTGKSVLADYLSQVLPATLVPELGRTLIPDSNQFSPDRLKQVAERHADALIQATQELQPYVIADTDVYLTQSYSHFAFGEYLGLEENIYAANRADLRLYLDTSVPFYQDGTRMNEVQRSQLDLCHRRTYRFFKQTLTEVKGSDWLYRTQCASDAIARLPQWPQSA